jgi:hypothetical protein
VFDDFLFVFSAGVNVHGRLERDALAASKAIGQGVFPNDIRIRRTSTFLGIRWNF